MRENEEKMGKSKINWEKWELKRQNANTREKMGKNEIYVKNGNNEKKYEKNWKNRKKWEKMRK